MKRIFGRSGGGKEKEEEIPDVSLDIVLANKEDIITKVVLPVLPSLTRNIFQLKIFLGGNISGWMETLSSYA